MTSSKPDITLQVGPNHSTLVDADSCRHHGIEWMKLRPQIHKRAGKVYATVRLCGSPQQYLHRIIAGATKGQVVDHINGNSLDNRASNLRICTARQNRANCGAIRRNQSGLKGVTWHAGSRKWLASISKEGVRYYLGLFAHKQRAAVAVDRAAMALWGEFAGLNYPDRGTKPKMPTKGYTLGSRSASIVTSVP